MLFRSKLLLLRKQGYAHEYPSNFLPLDTTDFVVWHHLFCLEKDGDLIPVGGGTHCSMNRCDLYNIPLPIDSMTKKSRDPVHAQAIQAILKEYREAGKDIVNGVRLTIAKEFRGIKEISEQVKELTAALLVYDSQIHGHEAVMTDAVVRFKTDALFKKMGFEPMKLNGAEVPILKKEWANNEPALLMIAPKLSDWSKECLEKHRNTIEGRIWIGGPSQEQKIAA